MSKTVKYDVLRDHEGDRFYREGETRELSETSARHLVQLGVLADHDPKRERRVTLNYDELSDRREALKKELNDMVAGREKLLDEHARLNSEISIAAKDLQTRRDHLTAEIDALVKQRDQAKGDLDGLNAQIDAGKAELSALSKDIEKSKAAAAALNKAEGASPKNKASTGSADSGSE